MLSPSDFRGWEVKEKRTGASLCYECLTEGERFVKSHDRCPECKGMVSKKEKEERTDGDERCSACRYPACATCGQTSLTVWKPGTYRKREYRCEDCADKWQCARLVAGKLQCATCDATLPRQFDQNSFSNWYKRCRACQHPPCCKCGQRSEEIWTPNPKVKNALYTCNLNVLVTHKLPTCGYFRPPCPPGYGFAERRFSDPIYK